MVSKVLNVVGARPNFMKIAPIVRALKKCPEFEARLVHTGQHYDACMSEKFFDDLGMPKPDIYLGVGSGSHGEQTGKIMIEFERKLLEERPDLVIVVGDVNTTVACSLVAVKCGIKVAHIEAGLRSFDRSMPEEINRTVTDQISDYLFVTEPSGVRNLRCEGIPAAKIHFVGNVMIDTLLKLRRRAEQSDIVKNLGLKADRYAVLTLHRPSNVDSKEALCPILGAIATIQERIPVVFPVHPRTRKHLIELAILDWLMSLKGLRVIEPQGYLDFIKLVANARFVLTDSGGVQEETTILGVPCLTLRKNTERPVTVEEGTNMIVGIDKQRIINESHRRISGMSAFDSGSNGGIITRRRPEKWDGKTADRIVRILRRDLCERYRAVG